MTIAALMKNTLESRTAAVVKGTFTFARGAQK